MNDREDNSIKNFISDTLDQFLGGVEIVPPDPNDLITVCDACLKRTCWDGRFMCDASGKAGTVSLPVWALRKLALEHEDYWSTKLGEKAP